MRRGRIDSARKFVLPAAVRALRADELPSPWAPGREPGTVVLRVGADPAELESAAAPSGRWLILRQPRRVLQARAVDEVLPVLAEASAEVRAGHLVAGYLEYEASTAFDAAQVTFDSRDGTGGSPARLAWFGVYDEALAQPVLPPTSRDSYRLGRWSSRRDGAEQTRVIEAIRGWISAGHVYQVNATHRLEAAWRGDPWSCFLALQRAQRSAHAAFVHTGEAVICSASPELLLRLSDGEIITRPMKGTRPRGRTGEEDEALLFDLVRSAKDRAENVMITDMARNDLGRVAEFGRVQVTALCAIERYPTVWQLVSTVRGRTTAELQACLRALFPAASITGAPKVRAMELIAELEGDRRGIYTGSIGVWGPGGWAEFNVAIRTLAIDPAGGRAEYGTGGGIVWDSTAEGERAEARWKVAVVTRRLPRFRLLETMRWSPREGIFLLDRHLDRLAISAAYFGFRMDEERIRRRLQRTVRAWGDAEPIERVIRLVLRADGRAEAIPRTMPGRSDRPWKVALARRPVDREDPFLFHKTTHRSIYERARRSRPGCDDVLLWNREGELTESTIANLAVELNGEWVTPPVSSGLLAGTMRAELLERGELQPRVVHREDLAQTGRIRLLNAIRGWIEAELVSDRDGPAGLVSSPRD